MNEAASVLKILWNVVSSSRLIGGLDKNNFKTTMLVLHLIFISLMGEESMLQVVLLIQDYRSWVLLGFVVLDASRYN